MRLYRLLLYLYPASFRSEYGEELRSVFRERRRRATNPMAVLSLWISEIVSNAAVAAQVHADIFRQDLRYSARSLLRAPGFTLTAILVTGIGIGASTAAFSVTDRAILRPIRFADSDRMVQLWQRTPAYSRFELSPPNFYDWRRMSRSFEAMAAYTTIAVNVSGIGESRRLEGASVTPDFFRILGANSILGRVFTDGDALENAPRTVIVSYAMWQEMFGGRPDVLGQTTIFNRTAYTIVGVMPRDFSFPDREGRFWTTLLLGDPPSGGRDDYYLNAVAKLKPGVSIGEARAELKVISSSLSAQYPKENGDTSAVVEPLSDQVVDQTRILIWALLGATLCLLLIGCTNLAGLLLTRASARRKELTVRAAIGAGRERLIRQLLTESMALSCAGGVLGLGIAAMALPLLSSIVPERLPLPDSTVLDVRVLAFAVAVTLGTGLVFGVLPAFRASRGVSHDGLKEGSRAGIGGRRDKTRSVLVTAEISISIVLLVSCGLLIQALRRVQAIDPGFRTSSVLAIQTSLPIPQYASATTRDAFYGSLLSRVRSLPGVANAAFISSVPMQGGGGIWPVSVTGEIPAESGERAARTVGMRFVTAGYFDTMGIRLRRGRDVSESDTMNSPLVAVVSESFVRRYWPGEDPLGRKFHFDLDSFPYAQADREVVGVVDDVRFRGLERSSEPQVYLASTQLPDNVLTFYVPKELVVHSTGGVAALAPAIRRLIRSADPEIPISAARTMEDIVDLQTVPRATQIRLLSAFSGLSILLAGVGIHGLLSFAVRQRSQEFGVRIALGAQRRDILAMVFGESAALTCFGAALGLVLAYAAGRSMQALLAGVPPFDAMTVLVSGVVVLCAIVSGTLAPALRAMRTDPSAVIRTD